MGSLAVTLLCFECKNSGSRSSTKALDYAECNDPHQIQGRYPPTLLVDLDLVMALAVAFFLNANGHFLVVASSCLCLVSEGTPVSNDNGRSLVAPLSFVSVANGRFSVNADGRF